MIAVEPSPVMIAQRPASAAPAIQAVAENLPFLAALLPDVEIEAVPVPADCTDGLGLAAGGRDGNRRALTGMRE